jgi:DUSAM domain-containing protein
MPCAHTQAEAVGEAMTDDDQLDWERIEDLNQKVSVRGEPLDLSDETCAILRGGARLVALRPEDATDALREATATVGFLRQIMRRLRDGSTRLGTADAQAERLRDKGEFAGARKVLEDALAAETVPFYREQLTGRLEDLTTLETVFLTGHVAGDFHPWGQVRALALRAQQGKSLELRDDVRGFLRQTGPSVALSEADVEEALQTVESTVVLLGRMVKRMDDGKQRLSQALYQMIRCQEAGDLAGARQRMREVLAVEVVPLYRRAAEENLANLDEPT